MKWHDEGRFRWWYAFFGALAAALLVLARDDGASSPAGIAAFACLACIPLLLVIERQHDIAKWLADSPRGSRFRPIAIGSSVVICIIGFLISTQILSSDGARPPHGLATYAKKLSGVLGNLDSERARAYRDLASAKSRDAEDRIASELNSAFNHAVATLQRTHAAPADRDAHRLVIRRLGGVASAYSQLGQAAMDSSGSQADLNQARRHVQAMTFRLWTSQKALAHDRYTLARPPD